MQLYNLDISFHMGVMPFGSKRYLKVLVEHYYTSDQFDRFKLHGNRKVIDIEKCHYPRKLWNIISNDLNGLDPSRLALFLNEVYNGLDNYLANRNKDARGYIIARMK